MSADGEVEVKVTADGADDAAQELSQEEGGGGLGLGGGRGDGDRSGVLKQLGSLGRVLGIIAALLASIGPLLKFIEGISKVLSAFLAPLSVMLMRLLMPALRMFIKFLPRWMSWMDEVNGYLSMLGLLADLLLIGPILDRLPENIWSMFESWATNLPTMLGREIASVVPGIDPSEGERAADIGVQSAASTAANTVFPGAGAVVNVAMSGGLDAFVDKVESDHNVDL